MSRKLDSSALKKSLENVACPLNTNCYEAFDLLQECERWLELGAGEFMPDFAQSLMLETHTKVRELLDRVLQRKRGKRRGGRPKKA